jgi:hypothetical protein
VCEWKKNKGQCSSFCMAVTRIPNVFSNPEFVWSFSRVYSEGSSKQSVGYKKVYPNLIGLSGVYTHNSNFYVKSDQCLRLRYFFFIICIKLRVKVAFCNFVSILTIWILICCYSQILKEFWIWSEPLKP